MALALGTAIAFTACSEDDSLLTVGDRCEGLTGAELADCQL